MTLPDHHLRHHRARAADVVREARRHPLGTVHPHERRSPLGAVGRLLRRPEPAYRREFRIA